MSSCVQFVATRRNGRALCFSGFYYHINKTVDERSYWKCRTKGCKSTVVTINDVISSASGQHFHEPNDSRVNVNNNDMNSKSTENSLNAKKQKNSSETAIRSSNKKLKTNNFVKNISVRNSCNDSNGLSLITEHLKNEEVFDSLVQHLNVEIDVDECGEVKIEDNDDSYSNNDSTTDLGGECSAPNQLQIMPNSVYFTNNCYTNIEHFDIELNNLFKVIRQSGFNSIDIDQLSNDWDLWRKRYLELKRTKAKSRNSNERDIENLRIQLEIAINAKNNADREANRLGMSLRESQNNVSALKLLLKKNLNNGSNNQCIALLNEINQLKRRVCAQVESHQSSLNEVKRLLSLDDNDIRTEFDQLAQERDEALKDNIELKQELSLLRSQLSIIKTE